MDAEEASERLRGVRLVIAALRGHTSTALLPAPDVLERPVDFDAALAIEGDRRGEGAFAAAFAAALVHAALHAEPQGRHVHNWLSETARGWFSDRALTPPDRWSIAAADLRARLQDAISLGINLRHMDEDAMRAALAWLARHPRHGVSTPGDARAPARVLAVATAILVWAGSRPQRAIPLLEEDPFAAADVSGWAAALIGARLGETALLEIVGRDGVVARRLRAMPPEAAGEDEVPHA